MSQITQPDMKTTITALKAMVKTLKKRVDVKVNTAKIGAKGSKKAVEKIRAIHPDLADFHAEMNGIEVKWEFIEAQGGGSIRIPPMGEYTVFTGEDHHYMGFGESYEALLLDEITPEGATYLVRHKNTSEVKLVFASPAEGKDGIYMGKSIAAYLESAMENGFAEYWPACFMDNQTISYADQEAAIERFKAPPVKPSPFQTGVRVSFSTLSNDGWRGNVLKLHTAPESNKTTAYYGSKWAQVQCDEGTLAWVSMQTVKVHKKKDAYEKLRPESVDWKAHLKTEPFLADLARAVGPLEGYTTDNKSGIDLCLPHNGLRGAGVLSGHSLNDAAELISTIYENAKQNGLDLKASLPLTKTGEEFNATEWKMAYPEWRFRTGEILEGLCGGLSILLRHASEKNQKAPCQLLLKESVEKLMALKESVTIQRINEDLIKVLSAPILKAPEWRYQRREMIENHAKDLGLSVNEIAFF